MQQYLNLVENILTEGNYKPNRTSVDTISTFGQFYKIDLSEGFPLLTTKDLSGYRWNSLIHELLWYFSGEEHIKNLREETKIWDAWADEEGLLETAYGRFWRRYPIPDGDAQLEGEAWPEKDHKWVNKEEDGRLTFDQIQYVIDQLKENPKSRRIIVNAWHPANATVSKLPPCHYSFVFNVQDGKLNTHLTQRSADTALGVPFNIAAYSIITRLIAKEVGLDLGEFGHTLVDAHLYCGEDERGEWYGENIEELQQKMKNVEEKEDYLEIREWILENAPEEENEGKDHIPGMLKQLSREPRKRPELDIADKPLNELEYKDFELKDYSPHPGLKFGIAE